MFAPSRSGFVQRPGYRQGGWINFAISAATALLGRKDKKATENQANADRARELALEERGLALAERQDERARTVFDHYRDTYMPLEKRLASEAFDRPVSPAAAERRSLADVRQAFTNQRAMTDRARRRLGVNAASGATASFDAGLGVEEARIEAGARTGAREGVRDLNFARQSSVLGYASPTAATPYASAAAAGVADASLAAARRSSRSDSFAHEAAANYGARVTDVVDTGLDAWRRRRTRSGGTEAGGPYDPDRYGGYV
jgi:hypothetical protein